MIGRSFVAISCVLLVGLAGCANLSQTGPQLPSAPANALPRADKAYQAGRRQAALAAYKQVIRNNPSNTKAWTRIGNLELIAKNYGNAIRAYQQALKLNDSLVEAWHNLAIAHMRLAQAALKSESDSVPADSNRRAGIACETKRLDRLLSDQPPPSCSQ